MFEHLRVKPVAWFPCRGRGVVGKSMQSVTSPPADRVSNRGLVLLELWVCVVRWFFEYECGLCGFQV